VKVYAVVTTMGVARHTTIELYSTMEAAVASAKQSADNWRMSWAPAHGNYPPFGRVDGGKIDIQELEVGK